MKRNIQAALLAALVTLSTGCASVLQGRQIQPGSELQFVTASDENMLINQDAMEYEDQRLKARFDFWQKQFAVTLRNRGASPMRVRWDLARYFDEREVSRPVRHVGQGSDPRSMSQAPSDLAPGSTLVDVVKLADREYMVDASSPLSKRRVGAYRETVISRDDVNVRYGVTVGLYLPIEIEGAVEPYVFKFFLSTEP